MRIFILGSTFALAVKNKYYALGPINKIKKSIKYLLCIRQDK